MADALREFADDLEDDGQLANNHFERLLSSGEGESIKALNEHWAKVKGKHLKDIVSAARTIAKALDGAATAIEVMKGKALIELGVLAGQTGLAMALIPVTGGLSALLGTAAIAFTKKQLLKLLTDAAEEAVAHVVAAMTEPAVAALEGMAADLVVQLGSMAIGLQDGVDLDQTKQAGKDGFKDGVQSGKESLHLASAGGGSGGGGGSGLSDLFIDHDEHDRAHGKLTGVSTNIHGKTTSKLTKAKTAHGRTRGRDSIAQAIDPVADKAIGALVKATKQVGDHMGKTLPKAVKQISTDHKNNDDDLAARLAKARAKNGDGKDGGGGRGGADHRKPDNGTRGKPDPLHGAKDDARRNSIPEDKTRCENDPVDVVTGEMTLPQTDLTLPGALPLILRRTHLAAYRYGQWFGRSWASTLDERIELDPAGPGAVWAREDGSLLVYPRLPAPDGDPVLPLEGPRLALTYEGRYEDETTYAVTDPRSGLTRTFTGSPYRVSTAYWLTGIEDRNNNHISFSRTPDGAPTSVTHSGGYTVQLTTDADRLATLSVRAPEGPVTVLSYGYDEAGNLAAVTNSSGVPQRFTYDAAGRITSWTDRNDSTFRYVYDAAGRVVRTIGPDGFLSSTFDYDTAAGITRYTDSTGATKTFHWNDQLQVVAETDALGHTVRQLWDRYDRLLARTDPLGRTTTWTYDDRGDLVRIDHPDGTTATAAYNELHQLVAVTTPEGATSRQEYDDRGNPTLFTRPNGTTVRSSYDGSGHLIAVDDDLGPLERIRHDAAGLPITIRGRLGGLTRITRDAFGRQTSVTDPAGATTHMEWTVEGKLARRTAPDGSQESWTYDGEGNCLSHTDATGGETRFTYTHFDLVSSRTTPDGARLTFGYDTELRLAEVTNAQDLTWSYTYDAAGRKISETDFDGRTLGYAYDAVGQLAARTNGVGQTIRYERDIAGRVLAKDVDGEVTRFRYDAAGHLVGASGPGADVAYVRDGSGRVLSESVNGRELTHAYDVAGRRTHRTTPSGAVSRWTFPGDGGALLDSCGHQVGFAFDASGRETTRRIGEHLTIDHVYDDLGRLTAQSVRGAQGRQVQHRAYTYRPDGHLTAVEDLLAGPRTMELSADGRVTGVRGENWTERYAYDDTGNQADAHWPGDDTATGTRTYRGTRLTRAGRVRYEHDDQGRVVLRQRTRLSRKPETWYYTWDAEDRLTAVTTPDGTRWRYVYDALGRRIAKQRLATADESAPDAVVEEVLFTWDGDVLVEQVSRTPGSRDAVVLTWDHDGVAPLTQVERRLLDDAEVDRRFFAIVTDLVGTPRELVDEHGEVAWQTRATLWGTTTWNRDASAYTPLRFPGQYFDPESGLHYNRHRHYDPTTGRYASADPLGLTPAPNPVTYVDNPTTWIDPLGLQMCPVRKAKEHEHHVVLGPNQPPPNGPSNSLARWLRNDPSDERHDPNREQHPGAHTYNGNDYSKGEPPAWMTNVSAAVSDRSRLSVTLDGMPNHNGDRANWNTPEGITEAFQAAARHGAPYNMLHPDNYPPAGSAGTAWEMSLVAAAVRSYDGAAAWGDPEDERPGRSWESIDWYTQDGKGGFTKVDVPKPDIPEIQPDLSKLPKNKK
ncbi:type IV secretion protein Rhs [Streptomyces bambusae]|uniref:Type IV secretion protein Rhs n=2 Tax=Streptomyces bambusae TaxID=1550616 RepID=A0ABS6ZBB6_9ACTN|nr:type IV secretion protein Rhs [Streptomyces bambusae]